MRNFEDLFGKETTKIKLSLLWAFAMLNYIYADILTLMDSKALNDIINGTVDMPPFVMLLGAVLMEIPIAMIFLSLILDGKINKWSNIVAGIIKTFAVLGSLFVGTPALYYLFFVIIESITTLVIIIIAWRWNFT